MASLHSRTLRLAYANPTLRGLLLPLLSKRGSNLYWDTGLNLSDEVSNSISTKMDQECKAMMRAWRHALERDRSIEMGWPGEHQGIYSSVDTSHALREVERFARDNGVQLRLKPEHLMEHIDEAVWDADGLVLSVEGDAQEYYDWTVGINSRHLPVLKVRGNTVDMFLPAEPREDEG